MALTSEQPVEADVLTMKSHVDDVKKNLMPPSSPGKKTEALMRMIAQEMVSSFFGEDDGGSVKDEQELARAFEESTKKPSSKSSRRKRKDGSRRRSSRKLKNKPQEVDAPNTNAGEASNVNNEQALADLYYSHINGVDSSNVVTNPDKVFPSKGNETNTIGLEGHGSFAGLDLGLDGFHEEEDRLRNTYHSRSSRTSCSSGSDTFEPDDDDDGFENESEPLSLDEIRNHVMEQMPQSLKDQIPAEAWNQIFGGISPSNSQSSASLSKKKGKESTPRRKSKDQDDLLAIKDKLVISDIPTTAGSSGNDDGKDDLSVCSELTGLTGVFSIDSPTKASKRWSIGNGTEATEPVSESSEESKPISNPSLFEPADPLTAHPQRRAYSERLLDAREMYSPRRTASTSDTAPVRPRSTRSQGSRDSQTRRRSSVGFGEVQVRHYERILSDNPACQSGPSLGIGWKYRGGGVIDVDSFESQRGIPRKQMELVMPRHVREVILKDWGYKQQDVADMVRNIGRVKNQRRQTINNLGAAGMEEAVENAKRKVRSILSFGMKKDMVKSGHA